MPIDEGHAARWRAAIPTSDTAREEPRLADAAPRATYFPLADRGVHAFRQKVEEVHWVPEEVRLDRDRADAARLAPGERRLLYVVLSFFGAADDLVVGAIDDRVTKIITSKEGRFYLAAQTNQECTHSVAYSRQIEAIIPLAEQAAVFDAVRRDPNVRRMADWVRFWAERDDAPPADVLVVMAFLEGVLFSGFFAAIQYFKTKNVLPGVTMLNEFISRDENIHTQFWCFLVRERLGAPPAAAAVRAIAEETVALSDAFFRAALPEGIAGLNAGLVGQYVRSMADSVLGLLGFDPLWDAENPLDFMELLALNSVAKVNFFEGRPTQYRAAESSTFAIEMPE